MAVNVFILVTVGPVKYTSVGCFGAISYDRHIIPSLEGQDPRLDGSSYKVRKHAIEKCAVVAKERGYKVFSLVDGGMCRSGPNAHKYFNVLGMSNNCKSHGKGGDKEGQVYANGGIKGIISLFTSREMFINIDCFLKLSS